MTYLTEWTPTLRKLDSYVTSRSPFEDCVALLIADTREVSYFLVGLMSLFADSVGKSPIV